MTTAEYLAAIKEMAAIGLKPAEIALKLNISRQWVYSLCHRHTIPYIGRGMPVPNVTTGISIPVSSRISGCIAEMLAACDLMTKGYAVYRPVLNSRGHDLIGVKDDRMLTFEVRTAWRNDSGELRLPYKTDCKSHHHAFVIAGEPILYKPELPI